MNNDEKQIPIWFFIGCLLTVYGALILCSGIYNFLVPPEHPVALAHIHADIWWSILLMVVGLLYTIKYWPSKIKSSTKNEKASKEMSKVS
ncbi:MAG: hypothetical protein A2Y12_13025 [Planctomycetes bacterium GWF2_42_9]|nr:MAG: hypothetical protein A2Y12_13025 [Planctomycetes bacterium GWF2_42_9]